MKKWIFGCAMAISALTTSSTFADYYGNGGPCDPCCDTQDFNGFYFGGNLGVFSNTFHRNDYDGFFTDNSGWSLIDTNFEAGIQFGYDWQCNSKLAGLVVDWNWVNTNRNFPDDPNGGSIGSQRNRNNWFTTIRARFGITVCDALFYVTGGAAVHRTRADWRNGATDPTFQFNDHRTRWGWAGGVGTEWLLGCSWSVGAELLFLQFSEHRRTFTSTGTTRYTFGHSDSAWLGRILVNYRFGDLCCF